jgi:hypothetical protein
LPKHEAWNGKTWAIKGTPNPKVGVNGARLSGVACSSPSACLAVGGYDRPASQGLTLAEAWNGKTWTVKTIPRLQGATFTSLNSASCRAKDACGAVGDEFSSSQAERPVAKAWNGETWTIKTVPF